MFRRRHGKGSTVNEREFEQMLGRLMKADFSAGTEAFRDALLERCLTELDADDIDGVMIIDDDQLDMVAAGRDPSQLIGPDRFSTF